MDAVKKEIREALLGDLVPTQDGRLAVSFTRLAKYRNGLGDGYDKVLFFGVMCKRRWYLSAKPANKMRELAVKGMQNMGRMMYLSSDQEKEAVYCTYLLNNPTILTYTRGKDGIIEVAAYSARGLNGWIACFRTLNAFQKKVPEVMQRMSEEDEKKRLSDIREQTATDRLMDKQAKKEKKLEKKRLRKEKRKARFQKVVGVLPKLPELPLNDKTGNTSALIHTMPEDFEQDVQTEQGMLEQEIQVGQEAFEQEIQAGQETLEQETHNAFAETALDREKADLTRQEAEHADLAVRAACAKLEADQAKLAAQEAQAKLEAAQAKLAAQEAQARLAEIEAQLAAVQKTAKPKTTRKKTTKSKQAEQEQFVQETLDLQVPEQAAQETLATESVKSEASGRETSTQKATKPKTTRRKNAKSKSVEQEAPVKETADSKTLEQATEQETVPSEED